MRSIAQRLIDYERPGNDFTETTDTATFQVTDRMRPHLATLMGNGGFRALLARALALASAEVSWLRAIQVNADGTLEGLETLQARLRPAEFREGRVVLLGQLLGLLVAFIGPALTSRLLGEIWPQLAADNVDFGNGDKK
jgi:nicotinic acid phosphoribosyltransferase